jgi:hypothetical protein
MKYVFDKKASFCTSIWAYIGVGSDIHSSIGLDKEPKSIQTKKKKTKDIEI